MTDENLKFYYGGFISKPKINIYGVLQPNTVYRYLDKILITEGYFYYNGTVSCGLMMLNGVGGYTYPLNYIHNKSKKFNAIFCVTKNRQFYNISDGFLGNHITDKKDLDCDTLIQKSEQCTTNVNKLYEYYKERIIGLADIIEPILDELKVVYAN